MSMARRFAVVALCAGVALFLSAVSPKLSDVAMAQGSRSDPRYEVTGFREARFGMTEPEIRQIAKKSFGVDDGDMTLSTSATDGTTKLIVHVQSIESSLGAGRIEYFFGYRQHRLFQVNVVWGLDTNPNSSGVVFGAARLQRYFLGFTWATRSVRTGVPLDDRAVLLFSGADGKNGAVSLIVEGARYQLGPNGLVTLMPDRPSRSKLTISYTDEVSEPDVRNIGRGEF
jgi:hypothetical protein